MFDERSFDSFLLVCLSITDIMQRHNEKTLQCMWQKIASIHFYTRLYYFSLRAFLICKAK